MKVTEIRSFPVRDVDGRLYFIVRVDTDAGIYGLGEVGVARLGRSIAIAIDHLSEVVIGSDPWETERLWQLMFRGLFFPAERVYACAISGIDMALWDIKAKSVGMPLYKLLGGPTRDKVVCYPHCGGDTTQEIVDDCFKHVDEGWKFVRTGQPTTTPLVGQYGGPKLRQPLNSTPLKSISMAVEQFGAIREAVGPDIQISTDVHTRLDPTYSIMPSADNSKSSSRSSSKTPYAPRIRPPTETSGARQASRSQLASTGGRSGHSEKSSKTKASITCASTYASLAASRKLSKSPTGRKPTTSTSSPTTP